MKIPAFVSLAALLGSAVPRTAHGAECTHGKLYVVDNATSMVHVIDVSEGNLKDLTVETTVSLPADGAGELVYYGTSADPLVVQYRGKEDLNYTDGFVRVIDTGFEMHEDHGDKEGEHESHAHVEYKDPSVVTNALIDDCTLPVHQVRHGLQGDTGRVPGRHGQ